MISDIIHCLGVVQW